MGRSRLMKVTNPVRTFSVFALAGFVLPMVLKICINYFAARFSTATHAVENNLAVDFLFYLLPG